MMKFKSVLSFKILLFLLLTSYFLLLTSDVKAQSPIIPTPVDYQLPYPGILPDHPLYKVKKIRDRLIYSLTRNQVKRSELSLLFADKKIGMAQSLFTKRKIASLADSILESQSDLLKSAQLMVSLKKENLLPIGLPDKISLSAKKHMEIMNNINSSVSDLKAKEKINQALRLNNQASSIVESFKAVNIKLSK